MKQYFFTVAKDGKALDIEMTPNRAAHWRERGYTISLDGSQEAADRLMAAVEGELEREEA